MKRDDYLKKFGVIPLPSKDDVAKRKLALEYAHKIREFEIELYWKRTNYFALFIGATATAYGILIQLDCPRPLLVLAVACLGMIFSYGWFLVNKGSKHWQENWEYHIDVLELPVTGPLHQTILSKKSKNFLTGAKAVSVSKVNQLISFAVFVFWFFAAIYSFATATGLTTIIGTPDEAILKGFASLKVIGACGIFFASIAFVCCLGCLAKSGDSKSGYDDILEKEKRQNIEIKEK